MRNCAWSVPNSSEGHQSRILGMLFFQRDVAVAAEAGSLSVVAAAAIARAN